MAGRHVAVGVVGIGRVDRASPRRRNGRDRMRPHRGRTRCVVVAVIPDIGLRGDIAEIVVSDGFGRAARDRIFGETVQIVVDEALGKTLIGILSYLNEF